MDQNDTAPEAEAPVEQEDAEIVEDAPQEEIDYKSKFEEAEAERRKEAGIRKRLETSLQKQRIKSEVKTEVVKALSQEKTGELDETQLDFLDVRGITEPEDIDLIERVIQKTGMTPRQALKDDYVQDKLAKLKAAREVKDATPSSTKRSAGGIVDNVDYWFAKYEQNGALPEGMPKGMAEKLVNRKIAQTDVRANPYD